MSRLDAGEVKMDKTRLDLGGLAPSTADEMTLLAEEKSIQLRTHGATGIHVEGDRTRLQQIIVNLIENAIKYTQEGGRVVINVEREGSTVILEVSGNGTGILAHAMLHLFA